MFITDHQVSVFYKKLLFWGSRHYLDIGDIFNRPLHEHIIVIIHIQGGLAQNKLNDHSIQYFFKK